MISIELKKILNSQNITMTELSEKTGISKNTLSLLGNNATKGIQFKTLDKLCTYLNCKPGDLLKIVPKKYSFINNVIAIPSSDNSNFYEYEGAILPVSVLDEMIHGSSFVRENQTPISIGFWKTKKVMEVCDIIFGIPFYENEKSMKRYDDESLKKVKNILTNLKKEEITELLKGAARFVMKQNPELYSEFSEIGVGLKSSDSIDGGFNLSIQVFKIDRENDDLIPSI